MRFGITLSNRGILLGLTTVPKLLPKPTQTPCPIWLTTNAGRLGNGQPDAGGSNFALRRAGRTADGWMTHSVSPNGFRRSLDVILRAGEDARRNMGDFDNILCHHVNIGADCDAAMADAKRYLDGLLQRKLHTGTVALLGCEWSARALHGVIAQDSSAPVAGGSPFAWRRRATPWGSSNG